MFPLKSPETALKALRRFGRANGRPRRRLKGLYRAPALSFQSVHKELGEEAVKLAMLYAMDASRRMGELLQSTERAKGAAESAEKRSTHQAPRLEDLGITKKESSRAQKLAALPEAENPVPTRHNLFPIQKRQLYRSLELLEKNLLSTS